MKSGSAPHPGRPAATDALRAPPASLEGLEEKFRSVRQTTLDLVRPLAPEDCVVQSMPDASPAKWHLAHTSWFFETFVIRSADPSRQPFRPGYEVLFNSYYNTVGEQHPRPRRGMITRPGLEEILDYRAYVETEVGRLISSGSIDPRLYTVVELGLHHEQQHQELLLTDIKHLFSCNPLMPAYDSSAAGSAQENPVQLEWIPFEGGLRTIGKADAGFAFDNERPSHKIHLEPHELASRPSTNAEYLRFMEAGGYESPEHWLSDGWDQVRGNGWKAPFYWNRIDGEWVEFTLGGARPVRPHEPVTHLSYYEADAFARWSGARLPTEGEWEAAASGLTMAGNFLESGHRHPVPAGGAADGKPQQMMGDVWEWTLSAYSPYPGYRPPEGALGEYNGKFMCNQMVLRGGSCATPRDHIRTTYRNFFYPSARWQFSGVRLARDIR